MKRLFTLLIALVFAYSGFSQVPEKMSCQAVVRNANDELVKSSTIGMQISILQGSESGTPIYVETHSTSTNINGLATVEIGGGTPVTGTFSDIDWSTGVYFLKTETDPAGGTNYSITGTSQILSVPYALHAKSAENITGEINYTESDPVFITSQASNITESDITNLSNLSGTNTGDQDLSSYATKNMGNENITNLADPVADMDAVNKAYVDLLESKVISLEGEIINAGLYNPTDADGNTYNVVKIGAQIWMVENLRTTRFNDGSSIPFSFEMNDSIIVPTYTIYSNPWGYDTAKYKPTYGLLYNWYAVNSGKLAPDGWHVATDEDWNNLEIELGLTRESDPENGFIGGWDGTNQGSQLADSAELWSANGDYTNTIIDQDPAFGIQRFKAYPGGFVQYGEPGSWFGYDLGMYGYWWTSSLMVSYEEWLNNTPYKYAIFRTIGYDTKQIGRMATEKFTFMSVRCVKD